MASEVLKLNSTLTRLELSGDEKVIIYIMKMSKMEINRKWYWI